MPEQAVNAYGRPIAEIERYGMNTPDEVHDEVIRIARLVGYDDVNVAADFDVISVVGDMAGVLMRERDRYRAQCDTLNDAACAAHDREAALEHRLADTRHALVAAIQILRHHGLNDEADHVVAMAEPSPREAGL